MLHGSIAVVGQLFGHLQLVDGGTLIDLIGPMRVYRGDAARYRLTVTDDADARVDITGATIEVQVRTALGAVDPPSIGKSVGSGITILTQSGDTLGQADVVFASGDTNIAPALYWIDVVITLAGDRVHIVAPREYTISSVVNAP